MSLVHRCTSAQRCKPNTVWLSPQHLDGEWATIYPEWPHAHHQRIPIWPYRPIWRTPDPAIWLPAAGGARGPVSCMREWPRVGPAPAVRPAQARAQPRACTRTLMALCIRGSCACCNCACARARGPGVASESALRRTALISRPFGLLAAPAPGNAASGQGRAPGAAPDARLHTPQL